MTPQAEEDPYPPKPPEIERRLRVPVKQLVGIAVLALVPVLSALGVLDERWATVDTTIGAVHATIDWPTRVRGTLTRPMTVAIANRSAATLDAIDVTFDPAYLDRFAHVTLMPMPRDAYTVSFSSVAPGETRRVRLAFEGDVVGRHRGTITIRAAARSATVHVRTTVLP